MKMKEIDATAKFLDLPRELKMLRQMKVTVILTIAGTVEYKDNNNDNIIIIIIIIGTLTTSLGVMIGSCSSDSQHGRPDCHPTNAGCSFFRYINDDVRNHNDQRP